MKAASRLALPLLLLGSAGPVWGQTDYEALIPEPDAYAEPVPIPEDLADRPDVQDRPDVNPNVYRAFLGKLVLTESGRRIGAVANFVFNTATDEVEAALVEMDEAAGLESRTVALPWDAITVETRRNVLITKMELSDIAALDPFDPEALESPAYEALEDPLLDTGER